MNDSTDDSLAPYSEPPPEGEPLRFSTTIEPRRFFGLSLKNGLLNLITLTLYRFWGKTEVRQRVWRGIRLNDEAFEYTGRGVELFIGFLLALLVIGLPFLIVIFGIQFTQHWAFGLALLPLYVGLFWLWGFGVFSAFRYMASRTTWRGVRFRLKGSASAYAWNYLLAIFLGGLTAGWFWPHAERQLASRVWEELRFGDRRLRFRMERSERFGIYGPFALGWFGTLVGYIALSAALVAAAMAAGPSLQPSADGQPPVPSVLFTLMVYAVILAVSPIFLLIWAPYQAALLRSIAGGVTLDKSTFTLNVKAIPLWWLTVTNLFALLVSLGFLMPWVQARTARFLVQRLESTGTARLDLARQAERGPGSGEGLADAFGFSSI
ncbi:MAG: hypothetical protein RLZZ542_1041 [Pseudomonadota bacterium]|jgi:uncharacterized membrane protein YjgN (DUF898 family)